MAYVIEYGGQVPAEQAVRKGKRKKWILAVCLLMAAVLVRYFWGDALTRILIPGEDTVTIQAFSNMMSALGEGEGFSECVTSFCREVIYGAS